MDNLEIEDFYHHDFTTASEWEVFIARLEEIIHEWKLPHTKPGRCLKPGDFLNLKWIEQSEKLNFADVEFNFKHFKLNIQGSEEVDSPSEESEDEKIQCQKDVLNISNDFVRCKGQHLEISRYYGIREFLVLVAGRWDAVMDETRTKILLSSITMAANNANCDIPIFVQVQEPWQNMYMGISIGRGTCSHFDMVHLERIPPHCKYLTGLLALFKQKIGEGCGVGIESVVVSVRFSYVLKDLTISTWTQDPPDFDVMQGEALGVAELGKLPFGATFDPIAELHLFATWPEVSETVVVDSEGFTDLEPQLAPEWSVQVKMVPSPACLLGEYLSDFLMLCTDSKLMADMVGITTGANDEEALSAALDVLTESKLATLFNVSDRLPKLSGSTKSKNVEGPLADEVLMSILFFLFPDAEDNPKSPYGDVSSYTMEDDSPKLVKTCAKDGLVWRLAIVAAHCTHNLGGARAFAQLWHEFVQEIRFRWERDILIPGIASGFPDSVKTCLLHQKLQMLNYCIGKKKAREESAYRRQSIDDDPETESDEEEFFECSSEETIDKEVPTAKQELKEKHLLWNKPAGRLAKHKLLRLIKTGDPLYLPVTQEPVPKTEDQLEEDAQVMMQLGTDKYASEMRARLMSASLLSDMESFQAANPGCVLEDFIRWYSPRDWIEEEGLDEWGQVKGHLSPRMMIPDNPWSTTWASAQPVPAHRQKRLFDDTKEAEKVLHYLSSRRLGQAALLLLPVLTHAALYTISSQKQQPFPSLNDIVKPIWEHLQIATKPIQQNLLLYKDIKAHIENVEAVIAQATSLQRKLGGNCVTDEFSTFLSQVIREQEVKVPGGPKGYIGRRITTMFRNAQKATHMMPSDDSDHETDAGDDVQHKTFPEPWSKKFILRTIAPRPVPTSSPQPQRLYACLKRNYIRLAGFFSEDTIFM